MKKTTIVSTKNAPAAIGPYSQAVIIGDMLYASGQIPLDPDTGKLVGKTIIQQTSQIMKNIGAVLDAAGTSFENVVKTTCFLTDMNDFSQFNTVYVTSFHSSLYSIWLLSNHFNIKHCCSPLSLSKIY